MPVGSVLITGDDAVNSSKFHSLPSYPIGFREEDSNRSHSGRFEGRFLLRWRAGAMLGRLPAIDASPARGRARGGSVGSFRKPIACVSL